MGKIRSSFLDKLGYHLKWVCEAGVQGSAWLEKEILSFISLYILPKTTRLKETF